MNGSGLPTGMETILVVDDLAILRETFRGMLELHGYKVLEAANGVEALGLLEERYTDLLISDLVMPKMNGGELIRRLQERFPKVRVVATTGYSDGIIVPDGIPLLGKPVTMGTLLTTVREVLDR